MSTPIHRVVVVGASTAGLSTAESLRRGGHRGEIALIGDEPSPPYSRPPLLNQVLRGDWSPERAQLRSADELTALRLELRVGTTATGLDLDAREVSLSDGSTTDYDALVIATGVRPRVLPGVDGVSGVHSLRTLEDALNFRKRLVPRSRLVVVGAGLLGTEAAALARSEGVDVCVVEPASAPLAGLVGDQAGAVVAAAHREHGVDLRTSTGVASILSVDRRATGVWLSDGTTLSADTVLVAIGSRPNVEWLRGSGIVLDDGVVCDRFCSAAPGVWAAGDVAQWQHPVLRAPVRVEHRANAAAQGALVASNILAEGALTPFESVPHYWSEQYDLRIDVHGHLAGHDECHVLELDPESRRFLAVYRRGEHLTGVAGINIAPRVLRPWRTALSAATTWRSVLHGG
ncbi:NAD(P)/FAD-dependent oxidoreductase [Umezawaea beigongshangensis]|uniref:NAD(P)/FAD-dependent oxidoreductase n=1 Tax=Umezawaea beigongshangensis TaxID=2780383 RepID=UPI0018F1BE33|nr:FAD-dependent oxidoreductase [Umezawaea beigongshangensis]